MNPAQRSFLPSVRQQVRGEIQSGGPITFARFMELALYTPGAGYYERSYCLGRNGDFFTSVSVGPLFGQLLAFQFAQWLDGIAPSGKIQLAEAGAHDGRLAADILAWMERRRPDLFERLEYWLIDPSPTRRRWQEGTLRSWNARLAWGEDITSVNEGKICGIIFSNEFFDALPIHRLAWGAPAQKWQEWRVDTEGEKFVWRLGALSREAAGWLPHVPAELARALPDRFVLELSPKAENWWHAAAIALQQGKLLTFDYGPAGDGWFRPDRPAGTLRAFARHCVSAEVLADPGGQDLTADVNFSALEEAGRAAGLHTEVRRPQAQFLTQIMSETQIHPETFEVLNQKSVRQFQTLTHPEHLGSRFQVLVQARR
jgi:SAM-dependent MidA family methyltransferase